MKWFRRGERPTDADQWQRIQAEVGRAKKDRYAQTVTQRDLVDEVARVLFRADPIGINFETNTDEYEAEAESIVIALPTAQGPADVKALVHESFVKWFDAQIAGPIERYSGVASEIWSLWQRHQGRMGLDSR